MLDWIVAEVDRQEPDRDVAFAAAQMLQAATFGYVDHVAERVVGVYEAERERWVANRNTVRAAMLGTILSAGPTDLATAEHALGYRLRRHHLGVVAWCEQGDAATGGGLHRLETLVNDIARRLGAQGHPLFLAQDGATAWAWLPLGQSDPVLDADALAAIDAMLEPDHGGVRVALGRPAAGPDGFRSSHDEAVRSHQVAVIAGARAARVITYADPEVRVAGLLASDQATTRRLVHESLGALAADHESAERMRDTLLCFLTAGSSYVLTGEILHLHKNTVKYRIERAVECRARPLDEDRLQLELALVACRWLGSAVLAD